MAVDDGMQSVEAVFHIDRCDLRTSAERWPYAVERSAEIDAAWSVRLSRAPHFWNGTVLLLRRSTARVSGGVLSGEMWVTDFKSFAHWKDAGRPDADAFDCFGSIILRSAEGHVLLGRQRQGLSAGQCYLPSGVIDDADIDPDAGSRVAGGGNRRVDTCVGMDAAPRVAVGMAGTVNIDRNVSREMAEETGLDARLLSRRPGYLVTRAGSLLSIGVVFDTGAPSADLRADILARIARDPDPELADVIAIASPADFAGLDVQRYSVLAIAYLLGEMLK
jgi:hypothetical protein